MYPKASTASYEDCVQLALQALAAYQKSQEDLRAITEHYTLKASSAAERRVAAVMAAGDPRKKDAIEDCKLFGRETTMYATLALMLKDRQ